jgi:2,3,4,5-tetrahydropyridine-2-carboxylate N-succinyltransferase
MDTNALEQLINTAFDDAANVTADTHGDVRDAVETTLDLLDSGSCRVAEKSGDDWHVNQWLKKAVLLSFRLNDMVTISNGPGGSSWWDKVPSKFDGWDAAGFFTSRFPRCAQLCGAPLCLYRARRRADAEFC